MGPAQRGLPDRPAHADRPVIVQARDAHRHPSTLALLEDLADRGPVVLVDYGWPGPLTVPIARVVTHGGSRPSYAAVEDLLRETGVATVIGLDIGATKTLGVALDGEGAVVAQVRHAHRGRARGRAAHRGPVVAELAGSCRSRRGRSEWGSPGSWIAVLGEVSHAVNLGIDGVPLALGRLLGEAVGRRGAGRERRQRRRPRRRSADGRSSTWATWGSAPGSPPASSSTADCAVGRRGVAGEVGHISVDPAGILCGCGQWGCLETVASGAALAVAWPTDEPERARSLHAAVVAGDPQAARVWRDFADGLAQAVTLLALGVDPDVIVLGGGVADAGEPLLLAVVEALDARAAGSAFLSSLDLSGRVRLVPAGPVAAIGAAMLGGD